MTKLTIDSVLQRVDTVTKADAPMGSDRGDPRLYDAVVQAEHKHRTLVNSGKATSAEIAASHKAMTAVQAKWYATRKELHGPEYQGKPATKNTGKQPFVSSRAWGELDSTKVDSVLAKVDSVTKRADFRENKAYGREFGDFEYKGYDVYAGEGDGKWHIYRGRNLIEKVASKDAARSAIDKMQPHARKDGEAAEGKRPFDREDTALSDPDAPTQLPDPIADAGETGLAAPVVEPLRRAAGCMVIAENGQVLLLRRAPDRKDWANVWAFPAGHVEDGEEPGAAALRELAEETGYVAEGHNGLLTRTVNLGVDFACFAVRVPAPFVPTLNEEHTAFAWVHASEVGGMGDKGETGGLITEADAIERAGRTDDAGNWKEEDHPRAKDGKFGSGGGNAAPAKGEEPASPEAPKGTSNAPEGEKGGSGGEGSQASGGQQKPPKAKAATSLIERHLENHPETEEARIELGDKIADEVGARELLDEARKKIAALNGKQTKSLVEDGGHMINDKQYTPEREKLHRKMLGEVFTPEAVARATPKPGEKPVMIMLGGRGGSGKSWFTNKRPGDSSPIDKSKFIVIDSDEFKQMMPEYEGWNAGQLHEESSDVLERAANRALELGINVIFDVTMKSSKSVEERIIQYKGADKDYDIHGYYMHASPQKATKQALQRFKGGMERNGKGRLVPPEIVLANTDNEKNFDKAKASFSKWAVYDNNGSGGPKLHASSDDKD